MAEVLVEYPDIVVSVDGAKYRAQACAAPGPDGLIEGWIEFIPLDGRTPLRSPRETTQPNYADSMYWATGITGVYLEGALRRALSPIVIREAPAPSAPFFDGPAPEPTRVPAADLRTPATAVLNPFSVYDKGERLLRQELGALSARHLVNITTAYQLSDEPVSVLNRLPAAHLIEIIVTGVRQQLLR